MEETMKKYVIGMGSFGKVYQFKYNSTYYAIKRIKVYDQLDFENCLNEIQILEKLPPHRNIVGYVGHTVISKSFEIYIAMEFIEGSNLSDVMKNSSHIIKEEQLLNWLMQAALALNFLQQHHILHRDIKPENLMILNNGTIKLIDFGLSKFVPPETYLTTRAGTPIYMSPQMCQKNTKYNYPSDVWSLGITFYQLATGNLPFQEEFIRYYQLEQLKRLKQMLKSSVQKYQCSNNVILFLRTLIVEKKLICRCNSPKINQIVNSMIIKDPLKRACPKKILRFPSILKHLELYVSCQKSSLVNNPDFLIKKKKQIKERDNTNNLTSQNCIHVKVNSPKQKLQQKQQIADKTLKICILERNNGLDSNTLSGGQNNYEKSEKYLQLSENSNKEKYKEQQCEKGSVYSIQGSDESLDRTMKLKSIILGLSSNLRETTSL